MQYFELPQPLKIPNKCNANIVEILNCIGNIDNRIAKKFFVVLGNIEKNANTTMGNKIKNCSIHEKRAQYFELPQSAQNAILMKISIKCNANIAEMLLLH